MYGPFFQCGIFSGLNKSEIGSNADSFLPCYSIELNETFDFKRFNLHQFSSFQSLGRVRLFVTHGPQDTRPPCPSPTPGVYSNSCPLWAAIYGVAQSQT